MKRIQNKSVRCWLTLFALTIAAGFGFTSQAQTLSKPEKSEINDPLLITVIADFIEDSHKNNAFYEDKGVISVNTCTDNSGTNTKYTLQVFIDDRYVDMNILKYAHYRNYVVLFDSCGLHVPISNKDEYFKTLNMEIGDRVYARPTKRGRWVMHLSKEGEVVSGIKETRFIGAGAGHQNATIYIIDKEKKFKKLKSV